MKDDVKVNIRYFGLLALILAFSGCPVTAAFRLIFRYFCAMISYVWRYDKLCMENSGE